MSRALAPLALASVCTVVALVGAAPATAVDQPGPHGEIVQVQSVSGSLDLVFQAADLPAGAQIDASSVQVSANGRVIASKVSRISAGTDVTRTAVLAFDTSRSMAAKIGAAKAAATTFISGLPKDVRVGLVTFDTGTRVTAAPTRDHRAVIRAVSDLTIAPQQGTALYDGTLLAVAAAGSGGARSVILVTDGKDYQSSTVTPEDAVSKVTDAGVALDAVFIGNPPEPPNLTSLVAGVDGDVLVAGTDDLSTIYRQAAQDIRTQIKITVPVPPDLAGQSVNLLVRARAGQTVLRDRTQATFRDAVQDTSPQPATLGTAARLTQGAVLPIAIGAVFVALLVLLILIFTRDDRGAGDQGRLRRRLSLYTLTGRQAMPEDRPTTTVLGSSTVARSAVDLAGRMVQQRNLEAALAKRLEAAGVPLRVAEWTLIHLGCALGLSLLLLLVSGAAVIPALLGLVLGAIGPWLYLGYAETRRTSAFLTQLPDTLQLISGSLSAGYSVAQAIDTVVREGQQPITGEFNRALVETRLGVPLEDALDGVAARMQSKDFAWVVMAYRIQRDVGGNLAELLATLAETMRERDRLRRQVRALSAEGRLSAWILGLLPLVFAIYLGSVRPEYLRPLFTDPVGLLLLSSGVVLLIIGALWMRKAVKVEV